mmetsp:Transcript_13647/g.40681  ORF Transcript_13647/g.40681 Transcript_13647/m.40681 type:complete len:497 (+) Transcript_13647:2481-3971(+)
MHRARGGDRHGAAAVQGLHLGVGGRHGQGPGALLAEGAPVLPAAGGKWRDLPRPAPHDLLLPPGLGPHHRLHALRGQVRQPGHGGPLLRRGRRRPPRLLEAARPGAAAPAAHAARGQRVRLAHGFQHGRAHSRGHAGLAEHVQLYGDQRPPHHGPAVRARAGHLPHQESTGDLFQALLLHPGSQLAQQPRGAVALRRALARPGAPHPAAFQGAVYPGADGFHPALRRADPGAEARALHRAGRRARGPRGAHRLGQGAVRGGVPGLHEPDAGQEQQQLADDRQPVGRVHRPPVGQDLRLGVHAAADALPHRRGHVPVPPGAAVPLRDPGRPHEPPLEAGGVGPKRLRHRARGHAGVQELRQGEALAREPHVREVPPEPQGGLHRLGAKKCQRRRGWRAPQAEATVLQLPGRQELPQGCRRPPPAAVARRAAWLPDPRRRQERQPEPRGHLHARRLRAVHRLQPGRVLRADDAAAVRPGRVPYTLSRGPEGQAHHRPP